MDGIAQKRLLFRRLHESGCFILPNPWDAGSACYFAHLGFKALATTSAGFAFSLGLPDSEAALSRDLVLSHIAEIVEATPLPVNADYQSGYGETPEEVAESVRQCAATGVAGLSIEDATGDPSEPLREIGLAADMIRAARSALDESAPDVLLTGRAECFLTGHSNPLPEAIERLKAYAEAGADVLYAPGLSTKAEIAEVVAAVAPKPVNFLVPAGSKLTLDDIAALGVRRISVGSGLARVAWGALMRASEQMAREGSFEGLLSAIPYSEINRVFQEQDFGE
jgi:2-methylisocitrate lyase-like PEP mutase family enzyme